MSQTIASIPSTPQTRSFEFIDNPFEGDFNPCDPLGQKLFLEATSFEVKDEDKFSIAYENTTKIVDLFSSLSNCFGWGRLVHNIKVSNNTYSIIRNHKMVSITDVQLQAESYYAPAKHVANPHTDFDFKIEMLQPEQDNAHKRRFYNRVRSTIIAKAILAHIAPASVKALSLEKSLYTWIDSNGNEKIDGPSLLKVILTKLAPSTVLGVQKLRAKITATRLKDFEYDVVSMLDNMQTNYDEILAQGGSMDTYYTAVFDALLSGGDTTFNSWVVHRQNAYYENSDDFNIDNLFMGAKNQYTNLVATGQWRKQETILVASATRIQKLEGGKNSNPSLNTTNDYIPGTTIEKWRGIKRGDTIEVDGRTFFWCKHHVIEGKYNGLYVSSHNEANHDLWSSNQKRKISHNNSRATEGAQSSPSFSNHASSSGNSTATTAPHQSVNANGTSDKRLTLSDKMRSVLLTRAGMTESEIDSFLQEN